MHCKKAQTCTLYNEKMLKIPKKKHKKTSLYKLTKHEEDINEFCYSCTNSAHLTPKETCIIVDKVQVRSLVQIGRDLPTAEVTVWHWPLPVPPVTDAHTSLRLALARSTGESDARLRLSQKVSDPSPLPAVALNPPPLPHLLPAIALPRPLGSAYQYCSCKSCACGLHF